MLPKSSFRFFCHTALTVVSAAVLANLALPSQAFSSTTTVEENFSTKHIQQTEQETNSFSNQLSEIKKSNFLIAKKDDDDHENNRRGRYKDDRDNNSRGRYDDNNNNNYRQDGQRYQSSKVFRNKDWNCLLQSGRLDNSNRRALVLQLDILEKPITRYANVVYTVYARQSNRWVQFYSNTGSRLIEKNSGRYSLQPEVIEFNQLGLGNADLSRLELRIVTQIRYNSSSSRDESLVFEDIRNYGDITAISNISQLTNISTSTSNDTQTGYGQNNRRRDDDDSYSRRSRGYGREQNNNSSKAFRMKDWSGLLSFSRLNNSNQRALVLQLDILEKPITRYANVVYSVYALQNNRWVQFYSTTGSRLIEKNSGRYSLQPEVIEFDKLRLGNLDLSRSDLKFVTQIRYDTDSRRDENIVFEEVRSYNEITEITSVGQFNNYR